MKINICKIFKNICGSTPYSKEFDKNIIIKFMRDNNYKIVSSRKYYRIQKMIDNEWCFIRLADCGYIDLPHNYIITCSKLETILCVISDIINLKNKEVKWKDVQIIQNPEKDVRKGI